MEDRLRSEECARRLKALANPERLKIIQCLRGGPKTVSALIGLLGNVMDNVSHHVRVLYRAKFVSAQKQGRFVVYALHPDAVRPQDPRQAAQALDLGCCCLVLPSSPSPARGRP
jgi:ArsR family transcriptional regulator